MKFERKGVRFEWRPDLWQMLQISEDWVQPVSNKKALKYILLSNDELLALCGIVFKHNKFTVADVVALYGKHENMKTIKPRKRNENNDYYRFKNRN